MNASDEYDRPKERAKKPDYDSMKEAEDEEACDGDDCNAIKDKQSKKKVNA